MLVITGLIYVRNGHLGLNSLFAITDFFVVTEFVIAEFHCSFHVEFPIFEIKAGFRNVEVQIAASIMSRFTLSRLQDNLLDLLYWRISTSSNPQCLNSSSNPLISKESEITKGTIKTFPGSSPLHSVRDQTIRELRFW